MNKWMLALTFVVLLMWIVQSQRGKVSSAEARKLVADGALLLDVRTPEEFREGHIPGAVNVPDYLLSERLSQLGAKERPVVVYCRSGRRSASASRVLRNAGFQSVHDLGAMSRW